MTLYSAAVSMSVVLVCVYGTGPVRTTHKPLTPGGYILSTLVKYIWLMEKHLVCLLKFTRHYRQLLVNRLRNRNRTD